MVVPAKCVTKADLAEYDFAVITHNSACDHMKLLKITGALETSMQEVIISMIDGKLDAEICEFGLGFLAAIDILMRGKLNLPANATSTQLINHIKSAFDDMHGMKSLNRKTDLMTRACETLLARDSAQ